MYNIIHPLVFSPAKTSSLMVWSGIWKLRHLLASCVSLIQLLRPPVGFELYTLLTIWRTVYFSSHLEDDLFLIKRRIMKFF